ncbi:MAG: Hint domain-containing protein [Pseudomonadota bacterium]
MSWIGLCDFEKNAFAPAGLDSRGQPRAGALAAVPPSLSKGTLLFELPCPTEFRVVALDYCAGGKEMFRLIVTLDPAGVVKLELERAHAHYILAVRAKRVPLDVPIRIAFSWNTEAGIAQLAVMDTGLPESCRTADAEDTVPFPIGALRAIILDRPSANWHRSVLYAALSNHIDPQGLPTGLTAGTPVDTVLGPRAIETIRLGDKVVTEDNGLQPVRWIGQRIVPAFGAFTPVLLRSPYLGLERDLLVAGTQRIVVDGDQVSYLFGQNEVLAEARHLVDGRIARFDRSSAFLRLVVPVFDDDQVLRMAGGRGEGAAMGGLRRVGDRPRLSSHAAANLRLALSS